MQGRWRQVRKLVRWHWVLFPLLAAGVAGLTTALLTTDGGNRWCNNSAFSCSIGTNVLGVVLIGGLTSYWYYGARRAMLLARHRRTVLAGFRRPGAAGDEGPGDPEGHSATVAAVLGRYRGWRNQPSVTVVTGLPGSGKTLFLAEVVGHLAGSRSWLVPVPLEDLAGGAAQDVLDAAHRQLETILHDASINPGLIESLWRSLTRSGRLMIVIDDIDRVGPGLSSYERASVVQRLISSAQRLDVPFLATAQSGSVESVAGSVIELPPPAPDYLRRRIEQAHAVPGELRRLVLPALAGSLATPAMLDRVVTLMRRDGDTLAAALRASDSTVADLVLWRHLVAACQVPGAVLTGEGLEVVACALLMTGQREVTVGAGPQWQDALRLASQAAVALPATEAGPEEIAAWTGGGLLAADSSPVMIRFASPEVQAVLAAQFLVRWPGQISGLVPQLGSAAPARRAVAAALRYTRADGSASVHASLLGALDGAPLTAAAHAAALSLAIGYPPPGADDDEIDDLDRRLALVLADRVTASSGPALTMAGLRDAVLALDTSDRPGRERHLLTALHSSSFQVRLSVALALIRRGTRDLIGRTAQSWIAGAESPRATGVQHQLGLALWFCPYLAAAGPPGDGDDLYARGLRLAAAGDSNPLMFEVSLARGFKLAAWARPGMAVDGRAVELLRSRPRFWHSRLCLVHAIGIRLAAAAGQEPAGSPALAEARQILATAASADPHPLVREAARITASSLAAGAPAAGFCWLSESDMGRADSHLGDEAMRLLGDVSLLLNLIYCAEPWSDPEWRLLGSSSELPACIRRPAHRERYMTSGCPRDCAFGLCPYPGPSRRPRGRGELSAAFCQAQGEVAARAGPAPWHEGRSAQPQVDFWQYAEQGLASRDGWDISL